jgi:hypothetical protein
MYDVCGGYKSGRYHRIARRVSRYDIVSRYRMYYEGLI